MPSVLVAMSGGVDSSVAACLLHEQGYEVLGSHMSLVHLDGVEHGCCGPSARRDAAETARIVGFPFEICDLSAEFEDTVIADFVREHASGRTPNPCARCNGEIKFGAFLRRADALGIDRVATGHYVRAVCDDQGSWLLVRGGDRAKDQSYMLHMLGQRELSRSLFPIGGLAKADTRAIAERFGLPVATKPDSQELCFAPAGDAGGFVRTHAAALVREGGEVVDGDGRVIGEDDAQTNRVVVGPGELLTKRGLVADRVSWVAGSPPDRGPFEAEVRIRYRGDDVPAVIAPGADATIRVEFRSPQRSVAPGQSVVVYDR